MTFGPFDVATFKSLVTTLDRLEIPYEGVQDEEALAAWNQQADADVRAAAPPPAYLLVEIAEDHVRTHGEALSAFGISLEPTEEPDFTTEDYLCLQCRYHATEPGLCPKHHIPLLKFEEYTAEKRKPHP